MWNENCYVLGVIGVVLSYYDGMGKQRNSEEVCFVTIRGGVYGNEYDGIVKGNSR